MCKTIAVFFLIFFLIPAGKPNAQVLPREGRKLNYRIIGFSFPAVPSVSQYNIEIAMGTCNREDSFKKHIITTFSGDTNRIIGEVPSFGKQYTWRYIYKTTEQTKSAFYHFSTGFTPQVDTSITRMRIMKHAERYKDAYVFSDDTRTLYDMNGRAVWYLPEPYGLPVNNETAYGLFKTTKEGTITYSLGWVGKNNQLMYEVNYDGDVLWKSPNSGKVSGDKVEHYHHEFTKLNNGHYMIIGSEFRPLRLPGAKYDELPKSKLIYDSVKRAYYQEIEFGTLIEYDVKGNIVWSWKSSKYFTTSDVYDHTTNSGFFDINDAHENAFYFDEKSKVIYVSYKNINRILKVEYPSGKVLKAYGKLYAPDATDYDNNLFHHQHNCRLTTDGYLSVYNNNDNKGLPTLLLMKEPVSERDTLEKVWEYQCTIEGKDTTESDPDFGAKGSALELPDHSILACMTSKKYTKIFIVDKDKKMLWSAFPERWNVEEKKWEPIVEYIASMVLDKKELEQMIWSRSN